MTTLKHSPQPADPAAAPQPNPSPMPEGATPIAELVIADIRARAEVGVRKYGAPLHAHNGRRALMDLYQEQLDAAQYTRQVLEEDYEGRALRAEAALAEMFDALGWDESKGEPVEWVRGVVFARNEAQALITQLVGEVEGLRAQADDLAAKVVKLSNRVEEDKRDLAAVVAERQRQAAEMESLKAGLRALAIARDEGAEETHRWRNRAFDAEAKTEALREEALDADKLSDELGRARWDAKCAEDNAAKAWAIRGEAVERLGEWVEIARKLEEERDALFAAGLGIEAERAALAAEVKALNAQAAKAEPAHPTEIDVGHNHVRLTPGEMKRPGDEWTNPEHWARSGPQSWIPCALIGIPVPSTSEVVRRRRE